jgi:50S ribosomal protein L16 3-hydroxylase
MKSAAVSPPRSRQSRHRDRAGANRYETAALTRLGNMTVRHFLARYWQREPVLIRQAISGFEAPLRRAELFELARRDDVESRLLRDAAGACRLVHGPLRGRSVPTQRTAGWTLLVQGVDQHLESAARLVGRFRFVPDARLDDLMVSFASDGGGVGPHIDSYDVFLLQAEGRRRWRIQYRPDPACVDGLPIRRLARFKADREWLLEPGDMLYLPPGIAHDGIAVGPCMTCSIGFRTPSAAELADLWIELQSARSGLRTAPYRDPGLRPSSAPARLPARMIDSIARELQSWRPARGDVATALLRQLSEPKSQVVFEPPRPAMPRARFMAMAQRRGLVADRRTRMLYSGKTFSINGEIIADPDRDARALVDRFADRRSLPARSPLFAAGGISRAWRERFYQWYLAGWIRPSPLQGM